MRTAQFEKRSTLAWRALLSVAFLLGFAASAQSQTVVISGVEMTVAVDDTVTITNQGTSQFFGDVGTAGDYGFISGWGVSSGTITWRDTNNNVAATLNSTGMHVPVSGRIANSNGSKTGSVTLAGSAVLGGFWRFALGGEATRGFTQVFANGSVGFRIQGTVTVLAKQVTLLDGLDLDVDSNTKVVSVVYSGSPLAFGDVGTAGTFSLLNGWKVAADSMTWLDASSNVAATLFAPGLNVPVSGRVATSNTTGSLELGGSTTLGAALVSQFGDGTWAFSSLAAQSPTTNFWLDGWVTIPEPGSGLTGSSALLVLALLRRRARLRRRG